MNNIGLIKHNDQILCTGFIIRVAISARDITLVSAVTEQSDNLIFQLDDKTYDIKLQYKHSSGLSLFTPINKIDGLEYDNRKFQFPHLENYRSTKYFVHDHEKCYQINNFDGNHFNQEGSVVINERWEVFAIVVNNVIRTDITSIMKEALDIYFEK